MEKEQKLSTRQRNKGFTLIELLAVIIILAIIALITVPVIMNIIERANKSAFKDSAYGIIKAGELHYADKLLDPSGMTNDITFTFPDATGLDIKGSRPKSGSMKVTKEGKIELAISNGKYCARKGINDNDVTVDDDIDNCSLSKTPNPIITTQNSCLTEGICENGTKLNVKVNNTENYDFYVIKDDGNELTLLMNKNLGSIVAWISKEDYIAAGGIESDYGTYGNNNKGPLTALKQLEDLTKGWTNIPLYDYTLIDDKPSKLEELGFPLTPMYQKVERTNVRARLLSLTDIIDFIEIDGDDQKFLIGPQYLYENLVDPIKPGLHSGYWMSTADSDDSRIVFAMISMANVSHNENYGVRPVIKISKSL